MLCELCDAKMQGVNWKSHIIGKRHQKRIKDYKPTRKWTQCQPCCKLVPQREWEKHRQDPIHVGMYHLMRQHGVEVPESQRPPDPKSPTAAPQLRKCPACNMNVLAAAWDGHVTSALHLEKSGKSTAPPSASLFRRCDYCRLDCAAATWSSHLTSAKHNLNAAVAVPKVHCGVCMKEFPMGLWAEHERRHGGPISHRISCTACKTVSRSIEQWKDHLTEQPHLEAVKRFRGQIRTKFCDSCRIELFPSHWQMHSRTNQHIVASVPARVKCIPCKTTFPLLEWKEHAKTAHTERPMHHVRCAVCERQYECLKDWGKHLASERHQHYVQAYQRLGIATQRCPSCKIDLFQQDYKWHKGTWLHWANEARRDPKRRPLQVEHLLE